ncbi:MAG TPA: hypothetical protein PKV73_01230 [Agriterribacter sp.]|nr:hypothetical protein [Agriterribacter sp.]
MKRSSFFKSLAALIIAPKAIIEISGSLATNNIAVLSGSTTRGLISDLNMLLPLYYSKLVEKYGDSNYELYNEFWNENLR